MKMWNVEWIEILRKEEKEQVISNLTGKPRLWEAVGRSEAQTTLRRRQQLKRSELLRGKIENQSLST
jgi:hypothetical protein